MKPLDTTNKMLSPSLVYNVDVGKITNRYEYGPDTNKKSMFGSVNSSIQSFSDEYSTCLRIGKHLLAHFLVLAYFIWATVYFFKHSKQIDFVSTIRNLQCKASSKYQFIFRSA